MEKGINKLIKESIRQVLKEFMQDGFSFDDLDGMSSNEMYDYCCEYLGEPIGIGSSRAAFEIDDSQVLKVAINRYGKYEAGCAQNKAEYNLSKRIDSPLLVKVLYHADDYSWIVCERVLPCTDMDFLKILGVHIGEPNEQSLEDVYTRVVDTPTDYRDYRIPKHDVSFYEVLYRLMDLKDGCNIEVLQNAYPKIMNLIYNHPWIKELYRLVMEHDLKPGDVRKENLGITLRNGKPMIVILDSGLTEEILNNYYRTMF